MRLPVYFPGVRTYFAVAAVLAALLVAILLRPDSAGATYEARVLLELLTPLPLLLTSAGLLQNDPALSLVAATNVRLGSLLMARWILALAVALIVPATVHMAIMHADPESAIGVLTWLAPAVFLSALAMAVAASTASAAAGIGTAISYWAVSLLLTPVLQGSCISVLPAACRVAIWSSSYGLLAAAGPGWKANRAVLLLAGLVLLFITDQIYRNPERQVRASALQEAIT